MSQPTAQLLALADFNDARLDDERIARAASEDATKGDQWEPTLFSEDPEDPNAWGELPFEEDLTPWVCVRHAARHDPARTLREVAAKRALIANWRELILRIDAESDPERRERLALTRHGLDQFAYQLAAVHDDHPDYQEQWRP